MRDFLRHLGINRNYHVDLSNVELTEHTIKKGTGRFSREGSLVVETGQHTGRSAKDKYIVYSPTTAEKVWWNDEEVKKLSLEQYRVIKGLAIEHINSAGEIYVNDRSVGAEAEFNIGVRVISTEPSAMIFTNYLFRERIKEFSDQDFTVLHAPRLKVDPAVTGTRSETVVCTNFDEKVVIIVGTLYAGEIKKSLFSILNYTLPDKGVLPMHSGANVNKEGEVSVFFGLSGTGKTTLSTDVGKYLVGDDEHGLWDKGIFNFEAGCYAKTYKLSAESEPGIYKASTRFGSLIENVTLDPQTRSVNFDDKTITENGRSSYPLSFIDDIVPSSKADVPQHLFFLSADAFGILPAVSKLNKHQAIYYFLSGYTAKLAGTEVGIVSPKAAFSACFGAPFMIRKPAVYGELMGHYLDKLKFNVWLINTGWINGPYGEGNRFPIKATREIIRAIQDHKLDKVDTYQEPIFGLHIPQHIPGVAGNLLNPRETWVNKMRYDEEAKKLAQLFHKNFEKFGTISDEIKKGGPLYRG